MLKTAGNHSWAGFLTVLVLAPAVMVLLGGRDVNALDFTNEVNAQSVTAWMGRIFVLVLLALALVTLINTAFGNVQPSRHRTAAAFLRFALFGFVLGHTVLPSLLGAESVDSVNIFYGSVVLFIAYRAGRLPSTKVIAALKSSMLLLMIAGFLTIIFAPQVSVQSSEAAVRLPFIDFRYWGLGSNPNNIAPLALVLLMLLIYQPFRSRIWNVVAYVSAGLTILLAQSQTTWIAAMMILPFFALYRALPKPVRKARIDPYVFVGLLVISTIGLLMLLWELAQVDYSLLTESATRLSQGSAGNIGEGEANDSLLGRVEIWQVALDTWRDHFWFGYGPAAWNTPFRMSVGMPFAFNAHNQFMQSVSTGGMVALGALIFYLGTLFTLCLRTAEQSHGLTVAVFSLIMIRGLTEAPLDTHTLLSGELLIHALLIYLVSVFLWRVPAAPVPVRKTRRRRVRRSVVA